MKRIVKNIYDIKEGETFYFDDGTKFRVAFSNKDLGRFIAICEECEVKEQIGKQVTDFNFDGLNVRFMTDYIDRVVDKDGKEIETERQERKKSGLETMIEGLDIITELDENVDNPEVRDRAYNYAKKITLDALKNENLSLEKKKHYMEQFDKLKECYENLKNDDNKVEEFINKLEEE